MGTHAKPTATLKSWPVRPILLVLVLVAVIITLSVTLPHARSAPHSASTKLFALPPATVQLEGQGFVKEPYVELFLDGQRVVSAAVWRQGDWWILTYQDKILSIGTSAYWCKVPTFPLVADQIQVAQICLHLGSQLPASHHAISFVVQTSTGPAQVTYAPRQLPQP